MKSFSDHKCPVTITIISASLQNVHKLKNNTASVEEQTFNGYEHIVIDGGSNDGTLELLKEKETLYNLKWVSEPDVGIADAMNKGLAMASGTYVYVLQADDVLLDKNSLHHVFGLMAHKQAPIYSFPVLLDDPQKGVVLRRPLRLPWWNRFKFILPHQGAFVHRSVFDKIGGFNTQFSIAMDYDFFYRALDAGYRINFGRQPVALMGGIGIGSRMDTLHRRLAEERQVQLLNETSVLWRILQMIFGRLYKKYKFTATRADKIVAK